jgi:hypothetical protein
MDGMPKPLRAVLPGLFMLMLAACTVLPPAVQTPAARHAALVGAADAAAGQVVDHLAARERQEVEQAASLRFATGTMPRSLPAPAAPAAGRVLDPGMELVLLQAQRLAMLADGQGVVEPAGGAALLARLQDGVAALRGIPGRWPPEALRRRGLEGFRVLSTPAPAGADVAGLARDRQRALTDAVALMRAVVGEDSRSGLRSVLAQRHEAWRDAQNAMLNAARNDRSLTPADRMEVWRATQARLAGDPPDVAAAEVVRLLGALPVAHAAAGAGDAAGVEAFGAEVARFQGLAAQAR